MHHHGAPLLEINETEILQLHAPTPPSYYTSDFEDTNPDTPRYPALIALHVVFMTSAFFFALPARIALRSVNHSWTGLSALAFYGLNALGCAASGLYRKLTPDMYEGAKHASHGYVVLFLSLALSAIDITAFFLRLYQHIRRGEKVSMKSFWRRIILGRDDDFASSSEYLGLVSEEPDEYEDVAMKPSRAMEPLNLADPMEEGHWATEHRTGPHHRMQSASSERTLFGLHSPKDSRQSQDTLHDISAPNHIRPLSLFSKISKVGAIAYNLFERGLVFAGFGMMLTGIVVYTGGCRENYVNGCLAHLIKGGIFWCYGIVTFARFLGSFSELGWAWNISPSGDGVSAEFVESLVIFLYGITNTWMERFGAHAGDPYTTKQVQHISIAVMFWFAGLVGMGIESKRVRRWLAASAIASSSARSEAEVSEPPSYRASFNPFPALVIGVTGAAMSAHAQTYLFQVQIHQLWGWLLLGFSALRCLTYFFLWLGPPRSILPSRPPTEALGSFFLACGGLMFMFSTEEVTLAAMRRGRDDMMMFLNVAVAITCFVFCWAMGVVSFKGWLRSRTALSSYQNRSSPSTP
ncbi:hypothetical protein CONPUDRAFT_89851 [Coniophora puteana RWD-64-598 SS2]|uniref:Uncharacterized protein n=1 Tax=Coniophora puteana (strain RWD-64-598) TaxID=741705 RepID=A0A5M3MV07_CONPW|nr:uncharacterized protein CONPUDRAFT_89851 [Coniophora puteana RWD-64-598 SS2]EIW82431.1 hypothetical protein CONPUDRAFT_89851 [Coniophora puteana RWD-64-598 SS2]